MSNVLMNGALGGKLWVPSHAYDAEFLPACARDLERGVPLFVIERRSHPLFRWHADIDCVSAAALSAEERVTLVTTIGAALIRETNSATKLLVFEAPPKACAAGVKTGLHLVANGLRVTEAEAMRLRDVLIAELRASGPTITNAWEDAVDKAVYDGAGLRLPGSHKIEPCAQCRGGGTACTLCGGTGRIASARPYTLHSVWNLRGERQRDWETKLSANKALLLRYGSTRHRTQEAATSTSNEAERKRRRVTPPGGPGPGPGASAPGGAFTLGALAPSVEPRHAELRVVAVERVGSLTVIKLGGAGAAWCANVRRAHASSTVYYVVRNARVHQRCYCRKHGCERFEGEGANLPASALRILGLTTGTGLPPGFA